MDNLSILSTPRHHASLLNHSSSQEMLFSYQPHNNNNNFSLDPDDRDIRTYDAATHVGPLLADTPDGEAENNIHESNAINARLVEQQHNKPTSNRSPPLLNNCGVVRWSCRRWSVRLARSLVSVFSSQRCVICCWALVLAVGMVVAIVVAVALCVLESDLDLPLVNELRGLPEVYRFKNEEYEMLKRSILGDDVDT